MKPHWLPLVDELNRWRDAGLEARLWLRDDDAIEPTPALDRLIAVSARYGVPVALAVVPAQAELTLAQRLSRELHITPVVHGWSHANHAPPDEKKQELGPHRPHAKVIAELAVALRRMQDLFGARLAPLLVPPWNRIDPALAPELAALGFAGLSCFGPAASFSSLALINTHVDLIDWRGSRRTREKSALIADLAGQLRLARLTAAAPIGILTHHLAHDETAWNFLDELFAATSQQPDCRWRDVKSLIAAGTSRAER